MKISFGLYGTHCVELTTKPFPKVNPIVEIKKGNYYIVIVKVELILQDY